MTSITIPKCFFQRLDCDVAATVAQLYLWAPSSWLKENYTLPNSNEIIQWLLCLSSKVLCERDITARNKTNTVNFVKISSLPHKLSKM